MRAIDDFLNGITMYRLVVYGLGVLAAAGIISAFAGTLSLPPFAMLLSLALLVGVCGVASWLFSRLWNVPANVESWLITALILFCIMPPATTTVRILGIVLAGLIAIVPRYLVAIRARHALNPAAAGAFTVGILGITHATWWAGSMAMLPFTLVIGLLIIRKVRRFAMVGTFVGVALATLTVVALLNDRTIPTVLWQAIASGPLVFLAAIMLTEPSTAPPRRRQQLWYGALVAVLFASQLRIGGVSLSPELALLIGNGFAYIFVHRHRMRLELVKKTQLSERVYDYAFATNYRPNHLPGQYMEWTMAVPHADDRGNRRTFTIASAPSEELVHLGVKFYEPASRFKQVLRAMEPGDVVYAGQIAGDFVLPADEREKLVFIAGGIGVTPFRSMVAQMLHTATHRDIILVHVVSDPAELSYEALFREADALGVRLVPVLSSDDVPAFWQGETGFLTPGLMQRIIPDIARRTVYISGPHAMVDGVSATLQGLGVPRRHMHTDHFSGY